MKLDRKEEIILKAAQLFKEKGYNAVSMRDLAQELGIKAASLYNHIQSKQEILEIIIMQVARDFTMHIHEISPKPISAIQKLEEIIKMHIDLTIKKTDFLACMNNDWMHLGNEKKEIYIEMRADYEEKFREILQEGIKANEIRNSDIEIMLFSILSTLRTFNLWYAKNKNINPNILKKDLTKTLLQGIVV